MGETQTRLSVPTDGGHEPVAGRRLPGEDRPEVGLAPGADRAARERHVSTRDPQTPKTAEAEQSPGPIADGLLTGLDLHLLYSTHRHRALALAHRITRDYDLAADAVQEAFLAVWRAQDVYEGSRGSSTSWLLTIVYRRAVDQVRSAARYLPTLDAEHHRSVSRERHEPDHASSVERSVLLQDVLSRLTLHEQQVLRLAYFGEFTQVEIAELLEIPLGTVKARLSRALPKLRELLEFPDRGLASSTRPQPLRLPHPEPHRVRAWARANGYPISSRGPVPRHVLQAYGDAQV